jgi:cytosine deaminase
MPLPRASNPVFDQPSYWIKRARVPASVVVALPPSVAVDGEGLALVDIKVANGKIAAIIGESAADGSPFYDMDGGQAWPCFSDLHTHLDKGHIWPRVGNENGTHAMAAGNTAKDRWHWTYADLKARFEFGLRCAFAHGSAAVRTHLDCYEPAQMETAWAVFRELRQSWRGKIELQAASLATLEVYARPTGELIADLVARSEGVLGGVTRLREPLNNGVADETAYALERLFTLAAERGLDLDLHVDETLDPAAQSLRLVAETALKLGFKGKIICGHCCSLAMQPEDEAAKTIELCREAGIAVIALPMVNQYLQGRGEGVTPRIRGITLIHELQRAGVPVAAASDNCRDPFFHFGDHDLLEVFREFVRIAHTDTDYPLWYPSVTKTPASLMRLVELGHIAIGDSADLVLFRGRSMSELLSRPQCDRVVLRHGRTIDTTPPDHRELDSLFA